MRALQLVAAAFAAYVGLRAAFIFVGPVGAIVVGAVLAGAAFAAWRRGLQPLAAGLVLGGAASAVALAL